MRMFFALLLMTLVSCGGGGGSKPQGGDNPPPAVTYTIAQNVSAVGIASVAPTGVQTVAAQAQPVFTITLQTGYTIEAAHVQSQNGGTLSNISETVWSYRFNPVQRNDTLVITPQVKQKTYAVRCIVEQWPTQTTVQTLTVREGESAVWQNPVPTGFIFQEFEGIHGYFSQDTYTTLPLNDDVFAKTEGKIVCRVLAPPQGCYYHQHVVDPSVIRMNDVGVKPITIHADIYNADHVDVEYYTDQLLGWFPTQKQVVRMTKVSASRYSVTFIPNVTQSATLRYHDGMMDRVQFDIRAYDSSNTLLSYISSDKGIQFPTFAIAVIPTNYSTPIADLGDGVRMTSHAMAIGKPGIVGSRITRHLAIPKALQYLNDVFDTMTIYSIGQSEEWNGSYHVMIEHGAKGVGIDKNPNLHLPVPGDFGSTRLKGIQCIRHANFVSSPVVHEWGHKRSLHFSDEAAKLTDTSNAHPVSISSFYGIMGSDSRVVEEGGNYVYKPIPQNERSRFSTLDLYVHGLATKAEVGTLLWVDSSWIRTAYDSIIPNAFVHTTTINGLESVYGQIELPVYDGLLQEERMLFLGVSNTPITDEVLYFLHLHAVYFTESTVYDPMTAENFHYALQGRKKINAEITSQRK